MSRMMFIKKDNGIWISHLDLMRVFQRSFRRAGIAIKHTQGFNPHAYVSVVMPLSVGMTSQCEFLDFETDDGIALATVCEKMNCTLPQGVHCIEAYETGKKIKELSFLRVKVVMEYDNGAPESICKLLEDLFASDTIIVAKRTKKGPADVDIRTMIHEMSVSLENGNVVVLEAVVSAQNPSLNPALLVTAIEKYLPELAPNFHKCERLEVYDGKMEIFR